MGHLWSIQALVELVHNKRPDFIFLIETLCYRDKLESIKIKLGFEGLFAVDRKGRSGWVAMFWKNNFKVKLLKFGRNFIDFAVEDSERGNWRLTGFYGSPESFRRHDSWNLFQYLASTSSFVTMGQPRGLQRPSQFLREARLSCPPAVED